jgi:hypothetical protein
MKKLLLASLAVLAMGAQAGAVTSDSFLVTGSTTPGCVFNTQPTNVVFPAYSAFRATALSAASGAATVDCSRGMTSVAAGFNTGSGNGVVAGLNYTLTASVAAPSPGAEPTPGVAGTADSYGITITGSMPANQPGNNTGAGTDSRTLVVSW